MKEIKVGEPNPLYRRIYFDIRSIVDGITPVNTELGKQPQISVNGNAFGVSGISPLSVVGNGIYYADLDPAILNSGGTVIHTIYTGTGCVVTPGDTVLVVAFDPDADLATIKAVTDSLPAAIAAVDDKCVTTNQGLLGIANAVNTINTTVTAVSGKVDGVVTTQGAHSTSLATIITKVNSANSGINNLSTSNAAIALKVTDLQTKLADTTAKVENNTALLTTLTTKIDNIQAVLDAFLAAFRTLP